MKEKKTARSNKTALTLSRLELNELPAAISPIELSTLSRSTFFQCTVCCLSAGTWAFHIMCILHTRTVSFCAKQLFFTCIGHAFSLALSFSHWFCFYLSISFWSATLAKSCRGIAALTAATFLYKYCTFRIDIFKNENTDFTSRNCLSLPLNCVHYNDN